MNTLKALLDSLQGRKTYIVCAVILWLALCQRFLKISVPQEVWLALFGLALISLRASVGMAQIAAVLLIPAVLCSGCVHVVAQGDWGKVSYWSVFQDRQIGPISIQGTNVLMSVQAVQASGITSNAADIAAAVTRAAVEAAK